LTTTTDRLSRTIALVFNVAPEMITDESTPDSVSTWDSFGHLDLVMALEHEFGVTLSAEDALAMRSVGLIRTVLRNAGASL
jgi:acyl carrier protein